MEDKDTILRQEMDNDYPLIRMVDITPEARLLAVAWVEGYEAQGMDIPGKQKLASDIMNYARRNPADNWISVKDQLPDFGKPVLVFCEIYGRYIATYERVGEFEGKEYGNWHDGKTLGVLPPTHWQPLPAPPLTTQQ